MPSIKSIAIMSAAVLVFVAVGRKLPVVGPVIDTALHG